MDAAVRALREGGSPSEPTTVLLLDDNLTIGGTAIFDQMLRELLSAVQAGRSRVTRVHALTVDRPPAELMAAGLPVHSIIDAFTDPTGWLDASSSCADQISWRDLEALQCLAQDDALTTTATPATATTCNSAGACIVIAGLSTLLQRHNTHKVLQALHTLRACPGVVSMLLWVHADLHPPQTLAALRTLSGMTLRLAPLPPLRRQLAASAAARPVHGALMSSTRRLRAGRLCAEQQLYELLPDGRVAVFAPPPGTSLDARSLVESALQVQQVQLPALKGEGGAAATLLPPHTVPPDAGVGKNQSPDDAAELARRFGGSMRLEISEQERAAKEAVRLPYAHQGGRPEHAAGDARAYLPAAAGGFSAVEGSRLGHILYVRDSSDEHDSDEDPDDDLDI